MPDHGRDTHVGTVARAIVRHPVDRLICRWNWKSAVLTAALRGAIFFTTHLTAGLSVALEVLGRDLLFRIPLGGFYGALSQAFRHATPAWAAYLAIMVVVPAIAHTIEFVVHWRGGTPRLATAVLASVAFSAASALFNLFLMRRGVLVVGPASGTLTSDLRQMPRLVVAFVAWVVVSPLRLGAALWGGRGRGDERGGASG